MDPITTALALGAAAALKDVSSQVVKDAYAGLKALIQRKYAGVPLAQLEQKPESKSRQGMIDEELSASGADLDNELLRQAEVLMEAIRQHAPEAALAIGIDLQEVEAAALRIKDVIAAGPGVKVSKSKFAGEIDISGVRAGQRGDDPSKKV